MRQALVVVVGVALLSTVGSMQTGAAPVSGSMPRMPWGDPDLQGVWNYSTQTSPLERPSALAGREFLTDGELAQAERQAHEIGNADRRDARGTEADVARDGNEFWFERRTTMLTRRTSLITDPPEGKLPPLTPEAAAIRPWIPAPIPASWEDRPLQERCIVSGSAGPPMLAAGVAVGEPTDFLQGFTRNFQIFQSENYVAILSEEVQYVRMIPLERVPHVSPSVRQWVGDSRGHWESSTLVVETTNFHDKRPFRGLSAANLRVVERFTRNDADTLDYQFTVDDPTRWTKPWTAAVPIEKTDGQLYEYACHEGNYAMANILRGSRAQEKAAGQAAKTDSN